MLVPASPEQLFEAWTTVEGVRTFFAPEARIEPRVGGAYELYFEHGPIGKRGSEGCRIVAFEPGRRLAFTWNFPTELSIRDEHTEVAIELAGQQAGETLVRLTATGWKSGGDWDKGYAYFDRVWGVVLQRLQQRFTSGPIDWSAL